MTDKELLEQLFQPMKEMQIDDAGFTDRVVRQLPDRRMLRLSRLWTALCVVVGVSCFVLLRGWEIIGYGLLMLLNNPPTEQQIVTFTASAVVVGLLALAELFGRERYSTL